MCPYFTERRKKEQRATAIYRTIRTQQLVTIKVSSRLFLSVASVFSGTHIRVRRVHAGRQQFRLCRPRGTATTAAHPSTAWVVCTQRLRGFSTTRTPTWEKATNCAASCPVCVYVYIMPRRRHTNRSDIRRCPFYSPLINPLHCGLHVKGGPRTVGPWRHVIAIDPCVSFFFASLRKKRNSKKRSNLYEVTA